MSLHSFSVTRPVFIAMASSIVIILGGIALRYLPVDLMPEITYPTISVSTTYDDASPEEVEELITRPIEEALAAVSRVKEIRSISSEENSNVTIDFNWGTNLDDAASDVRDRIDRVIKRLPDDVDRPTIRKFDSASSPIMRIGIGTTIDELETRKLIEDQIQYRLERIDGVASCEIWGGQIREIHVLFDLDKAHALNVSLDSVLEKIEFANVTTPAGNVREDRLEVRVRTPGSYSSLNQLRDTVIAYGSNNEPVRLCDIAEVRDTIEKVTRFVRVNGRPGIQMAIYKQSGSNTVQVARGVLNELEKINEEYSQIDLRPITNSADYINRSIKAVSDAAISGGILAILVLLFFLRNIRSTMIIAVSIPMSIIATFVLIYFCGFTLNIMTLGGLALGIGMLVDNSIVVLENITRLCDDGMTPKESAVKGTGEVAAAILASTLTTLAVFTPLLFIQGFAGVMFREFSAVVAFSLACSLIVAISLVPMLSGLFLTRSISHNAGEKGLKNHLLHWTENSVRLLENGYVSMLDGALRHKFWVISISLAVVAASFLLVPHIGSELAPKSDEGEVRVSLEAEVGTSPEVMNEIVKNVENTIMAIAGDDLTGMISHAGNSGWRGNGGHNAEFNVRLVGRTKRERTSEEIANSIALKLTEFPGVKSRARSAGGIRMSGGSNEAIKIDVRGYDTDTAAALANRIIDLSEETPGVTDAKLSRDLGSPEDRIVINRDKAADLHLSVKNIAESLRTILAGSSAGEYRDGGEEYNILVKVKDSDRRTLDELLDISVNNQNGEKVVLRNVLEYFRTSGAVSIERKNQERVISVAANIFDRDMGSVAKDIQAKLLDVPIPPAFAIIFSGDYEEQQKAFNELAMAFLLALVLVYMVMACQFESFRDPLVVMLSVPLAACGVIVALFITGSTFNVQSFIGCIMLAGIVVNNAILLVDTANMLQNRDNMTLEKAVREAGRRRLRPILMTTLTTVLGLFPLALGTGEGGETQAPMARVVIGGLTSSTFITLFFVPAVYMAAEKIRRGRRLKKLRSSEAAKA